MKVSWCLFSILVVLNTTLQAEERKDSINHYQNYSHAKIIRNLDDAKEYSANSRPLSEGRAQANLQALTAEAKRSAQQHKAKGINRAGYFTRARINTAD